MKAFSELKTFQNKIKRLNQIESFIDTPSSSASKFIQDRLIEHLSGDKPENVNQEIRTILNFIQYKGADESHDTGMSGRISPKVIALFARNDYEDWFKCENGNYMINLSDNDASDTSDLIESDELDAPEKAETKMRALYNIAKINEVNNQTSPSRAKKTKK